MAKFKISYVCENDDGTSQVKTVVEEFFDSDTVSAREWAEDWAYGMADKGWHKVEQIREQP